MPKDIEEMTVQLKEAPIELLFYGKSLKLSGRYIGLARLEYERSLVIWFRGISAQTAIAITEPEIKSQAAILSRQIIQEQCKVNDVLEVWIEWHLAKLPEES